MILNKTRKHKERWRIIGGGMGWSGDPENSPNRKFRVAKGLKRKGGYYPSEMSFTVFFTEAYNWLPKPAKEVRDTCIYWLVANGYYNWLLENKFISPNDETDDTYV
jgi:hypothetical protein